MNSLAISDPAQFVVALYLVIGLSTYVVGLIISMIEGAIGAVGEVS